jgi:hypothetical protein
MKKLRTFGFAILFGWSAIASGTNSLFFSATNLPSRIGEYNLSYFSTNNVNVAAMLTLVTNSGGLSPTSAGPTWDFSQAEQPTETVLRTDIISPADGTDGTDFIGATWAEQYSQIIGSATNITGWNYYSMTNQGRMDYGTYAPGTDLDGLALYDPPYFDVPATVTNGQSWTMTTSWDSTLEGYYPVVFDFSATSVVDAYGTLILPNLGELHAWRVGSSRIIVDRVQAFRRRKGCGSGSFGSCGSRERRL